MHANEAMRATFGECLGLPAREALTRLGQDSFAVMDAVLHRGRPLARWILVDDDEWRLTVAPRIDPETLETYGVTVYLREKSDQPVSARVRYDAAG
jgi:carotenoid cleavage dioxygenase-like enzyme